MVRGFFAFIIKLAIVNSIASFSCLQKEKKGGTKRLTIVKSELGPRLEQYVPSTAVQQRIDEQAERLVRGLSPVVFLKLQEYIGAHDEWSAARAIKGMFPVKLSGASDRAVVELVRSMKVHRERIPLHALPEHAITAGLPSIKELAKDWLDRLEGLCDRLNITDPDQRDAHIRAYIRGEIRDGELLDKNGWPILREEHAHASKYIKGAVLATAARMGEEEKDPLAELEKATKKAAKAVERENREHLKRPLTDAQVKAIAKRKETSILMKMLGGCFK